jgi:hypothetical protein
MNRDLGRTTYIPGMLSNSRGSSEIFLSLASQLQVNDMIDNVIEELLYDLFIPIIVPM